MRPWIFLLSIVVGLGLAGCGKGDSGQKQEAATDQTSARSMMPSDQVTAQPGQTALPVEEPAVPQEGLFINAYFDDAGTVSDVALTPGDKFSIYMFAETVEPHKTNAAQFRLQLPPGVRVVSSAEMETRIATLGKYDFSYMISYECRDPGRFLIVQYMCETTPEFTGGTIEVLPGFLGEDTTYLGFTNCDFVEVRCAGGTATLRVK